MERLGHVNSENQNKRYLGPPPLYYIYVRSEHGQSKHLISDNGCVLMMYIQYPWQEL